MVSLTVPSPPCTTIRSISLVAAHWASSAAWPRCWVCATVSWVRLSSAWASRSRVAGVVEVAFGFTISSVRTFAA